VQVPEVTLRTASPQQTRAAAAAVAELLRPGDVVALSGELGAGKTCFVQGAASGLGIQTRVTSPTFVLMKTYPDGRVPVVHCDVYRLEFLRDVYDLGDELLAPDVVTFVEWGDVITPLLPADRLEVDVSRASQPNGGASRRAAHGGATPGDASGGDASDPAALDADGDRIVTLRACGGWTQRLPDLVVACDSWRDGVT
jgi:tRNA threonylcarbamoyladenosine biosynthesis protein TsaE